MRYLKENWDRIKNILGRRHLMLFLDYDGTLTPIVARPEDAVLSKEARDVLKGLSGLPGCRLTIISGRALADLKEKVGLKHITYVGNHGFEIQGPGIKFESLLTPELKEIFRAIKKELEKKLGEIPGAWIEDKGLTLSLHYRQVDKKDTGRLAKLLKKVCIPYARARKIKVKAGKKVFEIRPAIEWDKGKAVMWLLRKQKYLPTRKETLAVCIGDDVTDEDVFSALKNKGLTVVVGAVRISHAGYYVRDTREVIEFLNQILLSKQEKPV